MLLRQDSYLEESEVADKWIPAFATDQVRGLKAHGTTIDDFTITPNPDSFANPKEW
jgi:hypothetical protein